MLAGSAWLLDAAGAVDVDLGVMFALALGLVGAALVVSAWVGRSRGLIALGVPLVLVVGGFGLVDVPLAGGIGDPTYHPRTVAAVERRYTLAIGNLSVDLRDVDFAGTRRHVHTQLGIGQLNVTVPDGRARRARRPRGRGQHHCVRRAVRRVLPDRLPRRAAGTAGGGTLYLDADVGVGHIDIRQREETLRGTS